MEDSRWARRAWDDGAGQATRYVAQPGSPEEAKVLDALDSVREPRDDVRLFRSPGLNDPHPARDLGLLDTGSRRAPGVLDLVHAVRRPLESNDFSGTPGGFLGSLRNVMTPFG